VIIIGEGSERGGAGGGGGGGQTLSKSILGRRRVKSSKTTKGYSKTLGKTSGYAETTGGQRRGATSREQSSSREQGRKNYQGKDAKQNPSIQANVQHLTHRQLSWKGGKTIDARRPCREKQRSCSKETQVLLTRKTNKFPERKSIYARVTEKSAGISGSTS